MSAPCLRETARDTFRAWDGRAHSLNTTNYDAKDNSYSNVGRE